MLIALVMPTHSRVIAQSYDENHIDLALKEVVTS
jgi:hypothetical protein